MSSTHKNLSQFEGGEIGSATPFKFGIVYSEWNIEITKALRESALNALIKHGALPENIYSIAVPGSFELTLGAQQLYLHKKVDAVICLGCVIKGETPHFDFICMALANGLTDLNIKHNIPFIFGVLTTNTFDQAKQRSGGKHGNKGEEAAVTAIKMLQLF
jgi:6,7-dimethyl-8-ribityllumazine synthase